MMIINVIHQISIYTDNKDDNRCYKYMNDGLNYILIIIIFKYHKYIMSRLDYKCIDNKFMNNSNNNNNLIKISNINMNNYIIIKDSICFGGLNSICLYFLNLSSSIIINNTQFLNFINSKCLFIKNIENIDTFNTIFNKCLFNLHSINGNDIYLNNIKSLNSIFGSIMLIFSNINIENPIFEYDTMDISNNPSSIYAKIQIYL